MISLRAMTTVDLPLVAGWLGQEHVARWWLVGSSIEQELADCRASIEGQQPTSMLVVVRDDEPIGWCQWYRCCDYPDFARDLEAGPEDVGIDYAIGVPSQIGRGIGADLIRELVRVIRLTHPTAPVVADPLATNIASRRVLEKCGFDLVDVRPLASETTDQPMAIYQLPRKELQRKSLDGAFSTWT